MCSSAYARKPWIRRRTFSASSPRGSGYGKTTSSWISPSASDFEKLETRSAVAAWLMGRYLPPVSRAQAESAVEPLPAPLRHLDGSTGGRALEPAQVQQRGQDRSADLTGDVRAALGPVQA